MNYYNIPQLDELTEKVLELLPPQRPFFESKQTIEPYAEQLFHYNALEIHKTRQKPFLTLIDQKVKRLFNTEEQKNIRLPDHSTGLRSGIVDHHGILNHPVLIGVNIVSNFHRMFDREKNGDILTFATGNIPFNNYFYRRGFEIDNVHVNIYPKKDRNKIVYQYPMYDFDIVGTLQRTHQWKLHSNTSQQFLESIQSTIKTIDFSGCKTIGDQITKINFYLWPMLFREDIRSNTSNLISLEYDDLVSDYLIHIFQNDSGSFIYRILFDEALRNKALAFFEGHTNAWNEKRNMGTHFFWGLVENEPVRLILKNNILQDESGKISLEWTMRNIIEALKARSIFAGMFLKYSTNIFYAGIKPFAGYASANSLAMMQSSLSEFLMPEFPEEVARIQKLVVNNLTTVPVLLHRNKSHIIENFYAFDVIKQGGMPKQYFDDVNSIPVKYFMVPNLPAMYDYGFNLYGKGIKAEPTIDPKDSDTLLQNIL